ncbi:MAG TPA: hypothetical protein VFZ65_07080 [Planctomycetota bacterium]|nr:hypothetical protein [Planctomycetota bacterium]
MRSCTVLTVLAASLLAACAAEPLVQPDYAARPVVELARWQVMQGDTLRGYVRHLEIRDPKGPIPYYRIEDPQGRWLGHASEIGRFSRRVPFQDDEQDLGVWSMAQGVARLFEADAAVELRPVAVEADVRRGQVPR